MESIGSDTPSLASLHNPCVRDHQGLMSLEAVSLQLFMYISPSGWAAHDHACHDIVTHRDARYRHLISNAFLYISCPRITYALNSSMLSCSRVATWRITCEPSLNSNNALPLKVRAVPTWLSCGGQLGSVALSAQPVAVGPPRDAS
jgi:hypothetical protein